MSSAGSSPSCFTQNEGGTEATRCSAHEAPQALAFGRFLLEAVALPVGLELRGGRANELGFLERRISFLHREQPSGTVANPLGECRVGQMAQNARGGLPDGRAAIVETSLEERLVARVEAGSKSFQQLHAIAVFFFWQGFFNPLASERSVELTECLDCLTAFFDGSFVPDAFEFCRIGIGAAGRYFDEVRPVGILPTEPCSALTENRGQSLPKLHVLGFEQPGKQVRRKHDTTPLHELQEFQKERICLLSKSALEESGQRRRRRLLRLFAGWNTGFNARFGKTPGEQIDGLSAAG